MDEMLISQVSLLTGLSEDKVQEIIKQWVVESGKSPQDLSLGDLREVLTEIVQNLFSEVADGQNEFISLSN